MQPFAPPAIRSRARAGAGARHLGTQPADRPRFSGFFVMANTNRAPPDAATANAWANDLQDAFRGAFAEAWHRVIKYRDGPPPPGADHGIRDIDTTSAVEIGPHFGRLHLHAVVHIKHEVPGGGIHLNVRGLREEIRRRGHFAAVRNLPAVWVRGFTSERTLEDYILKGMRTPLTELPPRR